MQRSSEKVCVQLELTPWTKNSPLAQSHWKYMKHNAKYFYGKTQPKQNRSTNVWYIVKVSPSHVYLAFFLCSATLPPRTRKGATNNSIKCIIKALNITRFYNYLTLNPWIRLMMIASANWFHLVRASSPPSVKSNVKAKILHQEWQISLAMCHPTSWFSILIQSDRWLFDWCIC